MLDSTFSRIRNNLKQEYPDMTREIDNLVGLMIEEVMDGVHANVALTNFEKDFRYALEVHGVKIDNQKLRKLLT